MKYVSIFQVNVLIAEVMLAFLACET